MKTKEIFVQSGVSLEQKPFVQLLTKEEGKETQIICQLSPTEARKVAFNLLEVAEGAETDGFLITFFLTLGKEKGQRATKEDYAQVMQLLHAYRSYRSLQGKASGPVDKKDFIVTKEHQQVPKVEL